MDSDGSEIDDLADIELSNFALPGQRPTDEHPLDVWNNDTIGSIPMEVIGDVEKEAIPPNNDTLMGTDLLDLTDGRLESAIDYSQSHSMESGSGSVDSSYEWNAGNSTNPFRKSTNDLQMGTPSPNNPFRENISTAPSASELNNNPFGANTPSRLLQPSNPFAEQSPNNPFRSLSSQVDDTKNAGSFNFDDLNTLGPTEYVYMSRLPGENIGMVLGIDGDQENRKPIKAVHVKSITPGGAAARACQGSNRIEVGDEIREIDGKPLNQLTHDECISLLQEMPDTVVLTIYRREEQSPLVNKEYNPHFGNEENVLPSQFRATHGPQGDLLFDQGVQNATTVSSGNSGEHPKDISSDLSHIPKGFNSFGVTIFREESDHLGISIVPSYGATCDLYQIKRLLPGGACAKVQRLEIGDRLLACNGRSLRGLGQTQCLQVLKSSGLVVDLTVLRPAGKETLVSNANYNSSFLVSSAEKADWSHDAPLSNSADISNSPFQEDRLPSPVEERNPIESEPSNTESLSGYDIDSSRRSDLILDFEIPDSNPGTIDDLLCGHKEDFPNQVEGLINPREDNLIHIPPPVEFSDLTSKENLSSDKTENVSSKCVTNIDDLLFLDVQSETSQSNPFTVDFPVGPNNEFVEATPPQHSVNQGPDDELINLGSSSIEEFAEKCFESITGQIKTDNITDCNSENAQTSSHPHLSEQEEQNSNRWSSSISWDQTSDVAGNKTSCHLTVFPVSNQSQKFISTIPIPTPHKVFDIISKQASSTESQPFTTVIQVTSTSPPTNVTKIDVISSPKTDTQPSPSLKTDTNYPGSIVFHTHVEDNLHVHRSTTITVDGESTAVGTMNGYKEDSSLANGVAVAHTTLGVSSTAVTADDEEVIQPMRASKDSQGKLLCVASTGETNSLSTIQDPKSLNSSGLADLVDTLAKHESHYVVPTDNEEDTETAAEDEIIPTALSRDDKEVVMNALNKWQHSAAEDKPNVFKNTVNVLINSGSQPTVHSSNPFSNSNSSVFVHTTVGIQTKADAVAGERGEEHIVAMAATKDQQGKPLYAPAAPRSPVVEREKDLTGLHTMASIMADSHSVTNHTSDDNVMEDDNHSIEEKVVPTVLSKDHAQMVKGVIEIWNSEETTNKPSPVEKAAAGFMRGSNTVSSNALVHTTLGITSSARSGEEEELIQPMAASKDFQGKPLYLPTDPRMSSPDKEKDLSGLLNIASAMANYHHIEKRSPQLEVVDTEAVSEETIVPTQLSKDQAEAVKKVITGWKAETESKPTTVQKAALGFMQGANLLPTDGISHTTLGVSSKARSGEEEELIYPMNVAKDIQGKPLWVQPSFPEPKPQEEKILNESALLNFAKALECSSITTSTHGESRSDEEISEEIIKPVFMTSDQKEIVSGVINKWGAIDDNQSLLRKTVSRIKDASHVEGNLDMPDSTSVVHVNFQNGGTVPDKEGISANHDDRTKQGTTKSVNTSDVISQSKSSPGQRDSYREAVDLFKHAQNNSAEVTSTDVTLRSKPRPSSNFKAKLEGFQKQDSLSLSSSSSSSSSINSASNVRSGRPKSMFEISSSKTNYNFRPSGNNSSTYKPLTTIKPLGSSIAQKRASLTLVEKSSASLQASSLSQQTSRTDYPKTRQEDGSPFQQDVLAGIVGLGLKVKVTDGYAIITDIQRSGPLGKSGNVKVGDYLLSVNGKELIGLTDARVQQILRLLPRGLIKLVVSGKKPQETDTPKSSTDTNGDLLSSNTFADEEPPPLPASTAPVTTTSFIASANGIQPVSSHDKSSHLTDFNLPISTTASEVPQSDDQQPPITARIEISPINQKGAPMKIAIKPTTTPRHLPGVIMRPTPMPRYPYASSTNESWETSSEDSTPREPGHITGQKLSSASLIASQRKPAGGEVFEEPAMAGSDKVKDPDHKVTNSQPSSSLSVSEQQTMPVQDAIVQDTVHNVSYAAKTELSESPRKVPPPVAPKPRLNSSSPTKSDNSNEKEDQPPPVAPKPRLNSSSPPKSDFSNEKGDQQPVGEKKTAKISAGYERLQALAKAKPAKTSRVIEKSRTFVSSTAKLFDDKAGDGNESSRHVSNGTSPSKVEVNRLNSSLLPMNKRRQSTGSTPLLSSSYSSSLSRPKALNFKVNVPSAVAIPEATSPRQDDSPGGKTVKSPTNMNSALSPRRASLVETSSPVVFKFSQKTAPRIDSSTESREGKTLNSALSPHSTKDKFGVHKSNSPSSSHEFTSHSQPAPKNDSNSPFDDKPISKSFISRNRSKSSSSLLSSQSTLLTSPMNEDALQDTMKKFDDLLMDTPYSHTETDPAELLLWTPLRKDSSTVPNSSQKTKLDLQPTTATTKQEPDRPVAPPRRKPAVPKPNLEEYSSVKDSTLVPPSANDQVIKSNLSVSENSVSLEDQSEPESAISKDNIVKKPDLDLFTESFVKEPEISLSEKQIVVEDVITSSHKIDSETTQGSSNFQERHQPYDYGNLIEKSSCSESENIPALGLAKEILVEKAEEVQEQMSEPSTTAFEAQGESQRNDNSQSQIRELSNENDTFEVEATIKDFGSSQSHEHVQNLENSLSSKDTDIGLNQNIPALMIASNITHEDKTTPDEEKSDLYDEDKNLSFSQDEILKSSSESAKNNNEAIVEHAKQIVDGVFEKISQSPDSFLHRESKEYEEETASPASSEDEPPPLPGAPPPPIIFRQNSTLLTEREWLEDNEDVMTSSKSSAVSSEIPVAPGDSGESKQEPEELPSSPGDTTVKNKDDKSKSVSDAAPLNNEPFFTETLESQMKQLSSDHGDLDLNIVGQNTALAMKQDHSLDEEEGHSRSDSLEPLNSTGDSCHEAYALRVSSPNSVDVLSEDSGMPADEEFQEVNTDDTISPSNELRDFVQIENSKMLDFSEKSQKAEVLKSPPGLITLHDSKAFTDVVNNDLDLGNDAQESQSPPMLPTSAPPDFLAPSKLSHNSEIDTVSVPQAQSSDSQLLSKEVFLSGDETPAAISTTIIETTLTDDKATASKEQIINTSLNVQQQTHVISKNNAQPDKQDVDVVQVMDTIVEEKDNSASNVFSERKWTLFSNQSGPGCVIDGQPGSTTHVNFTEETLSSSLPTSEFISVIAKANETLNTLKAPQDTEILIVHLHREGESVPLGIELKSDREFWYKVSTIRGNSPAAKQGAIENGDFLIAMDNLLCTQCSLMRCMARITKPKHNSILVFARVNSPLVAEEKSSSPKPKYDEKAAHGEDERPLVPPRSSHPKIPPIKPRQSTSPTSKTAPPLSPPPPLPENEVPASTPVESAPASFTNVESSPALSTPVESTPAASTHEAIGPSETQSKESSDNSEHTSTQGSGILDVVMMKGVTGVGFCLEGGIGSPKGNVPIAIKRIFKGGPAEKCGQLQVKDEILEVNGVSFSEMRHYEAWNHLKFLDDGEVHLKIRRPE